MTAQSKTLEYRLTTVQYVPPSRRYEDMASAARGFVPDSARLRLRVSVLVLR
jgi:hypothetical protein